MSYTKTPGIDGKDWFADMAPIDADMYGPTAGGKTIVPVDTTANGLPGNNKSPPVSGRAHRVSGTKLRDQIRGEMYDPEKEAHVLMSCF